MPTLQPASLPMTQKLLIGFTAAWPTLTVILFVIGPHIAAWPTPLRALVTAAFMVTLMNMVSVPAATRLFRTLSGRAS
jgi:antibiotic biosynthesis monooxygenase (ABM) superfamily enzyme